MKHLLLLSVAPIALLASPAVAQAQGSPAAATPTADSSTSADDIVVTGIRRSLQDAAEIKRSSAVVSDVISAEDIGRFPDQNLADSLQRVTGVQIERSLGEGNRVSVRGLSSDFTRIQYNGRTITSSGARSFDFGVLGSDFVSAVEVYKTPTADMTEGGLSATVNVTTARPLDVGKDRYVVALEGIYEPNAKKIGPHGTVFINKMLGDDAAVYVGADFQKRYTREYSLVGFGFESSAESAKSPPLDYNRDGDFNDTFQFDHAVGTSVTQGYRQRLTLVGGLQANLTENLQLNTDVFYADLKDDAPFIPFVGRFTYTIGAVQNSAVSGNAVTYLDANGVDIANNARFNLTKTRTFSPSASLTWKQGSLQIVAGATYSRTKTEISELGLGTRAHLPFFYDLRTDPSMPTFGFPSRFTGGYDPNSYGVIGIDGRYKQPTFDRNYDFKLDASYELNDGFLNKIAVGGLYSNRRLQYVSSVVSIPASVVAAVAGLPTRPSTYGGVEFGAGPFMTLLNVPNAYSNYNGSAVPATQLIYGDLSKFLATVPLDKLLAASPPTANTAAEYTVTEQTKAAYIRADFATDDSRFSGNVGVRYISTKQVTNGTIPDFNTIVFTAQGSQTTVNTSIGSAVNEYNYWLPSLNAKLRVGENAVVRFGAARTLARAPLSLLSTSTTINANVLSINSSNPQLKPYTADQADLSVEYYFARTGVLSIAAFYKKLHNYIVNGTRTETYNVRNAQTGITTAQTFRRFLPANGDDVDLKGIELAVQLPFSAFTSGFLDGFGIGANATFLDVGSVAIVQGGQRLPIPGVSKQTYNASAYFEKSGFGARLTYTYRSGYTNDQSSYFGDGDFARSYGQLDGSLSYDLNDKISFTADIANITNKPLQTYNSLGFVRTFTNQGRRIQFGARARF